jgi:hypothetical protein
MGVRIISSVGLGVLIVAEVSSSSVGTTKGTMMNWTRLSLFYLFGYLVLSGAALLFFPTLSLHLLFSNGAYGEIMPRFVGMLFVGLGVVVLGLILTRAEAMYAVTLGVRAFFLICFATFYIQTRDPLFVVLIAVVGLGFTLTGLSYLHDRKAARAPLST